MSNKIEIHKPFVAKRLDRKGVERVDSVMGYYLAPQLDEPDKTLEAIRGAILSHSEGS